MSARRIAIDNAASPGDIEIARELFVEYARSLDFSLCFQGFDKELAGLPGDYAPPDGALLLAVADGEAVGIVALRPLGSGACEMKRLYVRPKWRGHDIGARLAHAIIAAARKTGYRVMRLDTIESMTTAMALYRALGFREIQAYYSGNPLPAVRYFELDLTRQK